jgi:hypothetical protein
MAFSHSIFLSRDTAFSKENKALIRRYVDECIGKGDISLMDELLAPGYVLHMNADDFDLIHAPGMAKGQTYPPPPPGFSGSRLFLDSFQRLDNDLRWDSAIALGAL